MAVITAMPAIPNPITAVIDGEWVTSRPNSNQVRVTNSTMAVAIDRPHFGHLSGCTYSENESWRKADKNGIYAEMLADATQVWPFLTKYLMEK